MARNRAETPEKGLENLQNLPNGLLEQVDALPEREQAFFTGLYNGGDLETVAKNAGLTSPKRIADVLASPALASALQRAAPYHPDLEVGKRLLRPYLVARLMELALGTGPGSGNALRDALQLVGLGPTSRAAVAHVSWRDLLGGAQSGDSAPTLPPKKVRRIEAWLESGPDTVSVTGSGSGSDPAGEGEG